MNWESYNQIYYHYILSADHLRILTLLAEQTLENFPQKLPEDIRTALQADFEKMTDIFMKIQRGQITENSMQQSSPIFHHIISIFVTLVKMGVHPTLGDLDFKTLVYSNEL